MRLKGLTHQTKCHKTDLPNLTSCQTSLLTVNNNNKTGKYQLSFCLSHDGNLLMIHEVVKINHICTNYTKMDWIQKFIL